MKTITLSIAAAFAAALPAQAPHPHAQKPPAAAGTPPHTNVAPGLPPVVLFDRPRADGVLWAIGHDWKASFDTRGCTFIPFFGAEAPRGFPLRIELARVTAGEQPLVLSDGEPVATGPGVRTSRGALVEVMRTDLREVEQSFVFAALPNRGAIAVELTIATELACERTATGLRFANEFGSVTYQKAVAVDAAGARLALDIVWTGNTARIQIPAAFVERAQLPLVLDPQLNVASSFSSGIGSANPQREPDVATIQAPDSSCVVWTRQYNATDIDCWAVLLDSNLAPTGPLLAIDYTSESWSAPAVAASKYAQKYLVVSQVDAGGTSWIAGRMVDIFGSMGPQFDVERGGVVGLPGKNYRPDVGGDPFYSLISYFTVVFEHDLALPGTNTDIYFKQVKQDGSLRTLNPIALSTSTQPESNPSISKSNRTQNWGVAFQRNSGVGNGNIFAAEISWSGALAVAPYNIAGQVIDEILPDISSPAEQGGWRYFLIAYQRIFSSGNSDIICNIRYSGGSSVQDFNLSLSEQGGIAHLWNQSQPGADSDGVRFVVGYTEQWQGLYDFDTRVTTISYSNTTLSWNLDDERVTLGYSGNDEFGTRICADAAGGSGPSPRYKVVGTNHGTNEIQVFDYGGYTPGPLFSTNPTQCGNLSIAASGTPALGNPVSFTVGNAPLSGTILGLPGAIPLNALGCNCVQGVVNGIYLGNPLVWNVPADPVYLGFALAVQGWTIGGSQCLGIVDLSDTINFTIH